MTRVRHIVLLLISVIYSVRSSEYRLSAQAFAAWNNVPTAVNLGLFNNETTSKDQITRVELINGTCFQYDIRQFTRCKYYGDCCAMTPVRAMERLAKDTFSCHDGFYIVDRCPEYTDNEELNELCNGNNTNEPELSLKRWPVRGVVNHLTYKNIYCAICNGLDPQAEVNLTDPNLRRFQSDEMLYDALQKVEWWPALVRCDSHAIQSYIRDDPTFTKLNHLVKSACMLHYKPPEAPDLCWDAFKSCPANTNSEIANLCHTGPANYIEINSKVFWNQFCAMCNNVSIASSRPVRMPDRDLSNMEILWEQERLRLGKKNEYSSYELLTALKPKINTEMVEMTVNDDSFVNLSGIVTVDCSEFVDGKRSFCKQNIASSSRESDNYPVWDLGSMSCYSPFQKICEWFIPEPEGTDQECSKMGCGKGKIIDPSTNQCIDLSDFPVSRPQEKDDLEWSSASICEYESQCRAAELGLINEEQLNCFCDKYCIYYNDCCADSRFQSNSSLALDPGVFGCYDNNLPPEDYHRWIMWGVMEITKCPLNYRGNQTLVALCDESIFYESRRRWWNLVMIPVTDPKTGLRYGNIYCAKCHGVDEVKYWKIELSSDSKVEGVCEKPFSSYELDTLREMRIDPPIDKVADECFVKAFLPPEGHEDYRICRVDASEYISTCPNETKNWKIGKLCAEKPASFVYSSNTLQSQLDWERIETTESTEMFGSIPFTTHRSAVKYRNSYCATCNDAVWLGCRLSTGVDINYRETSLWYNNFRKRKMSLVNFVLDFNSQSCSRHSDLYITHSNHETGLDTCDRVTEALRECPCNSIYDKSVGGCKTTPFTNPSCNETGWEAVVDDPSTRLTDYTSLECPMLDTSPLNFTAVEEICSRCKQNPSLSECDPVYVLPTRFNHTMLPSIHCVNTLSPDPTLLPVCKQTPIPYRCFESFAYSGTGSALSQSIMGKEIKLLNSVAVRYDPALYPLVIPAHTKDKQGVGLEILYARSVSSGEQFCSNYSFINNKAEIFLYCQGNGLQSNLSGEYFDDFIISGKELGVCVEYDLAGFKLNIQDYILSGISIAVILIYLLHYCLKDKKTLTSKFVVSSLVTLVLALVSYCLTNTFADSKTACRAVASLTQYFMIGVHSWTCALAIWMVRGLQSLRLVHDRGLSNYLKYALFAWSLPAVFVTAALLLDNFKVEQLSPVYSPYFCFIGDGWIRVAVFTGPIYLIVLVNVGLCIFAMVKVLRTGKGVSQADKRRTKKKILTVSKLQAVFGLHWILLFFTEIEGKHVKTLWMVLNTLVTLQGVTIVLTQVIDLDTFTRLSRMVSSVSGASTRTVSYTISNSGSSKRSDRIENDKRTKHDSGHAVVPYPDQASPL